jgi:hypothetical protein
MMGKNISKEINGLAISAEETEKGIELNLEGETFAVLDHVEGKKFVLTVYTNGDEPSLEHEINL